MDESEIDFTKVRIILQTNYQNYLLLKTDILQKHQSFQFFFRIFAKSFVMNTQIFEQIRQLKRQIMPNERLILFGSQARGDARPDSDWDLLALIDKDKRNFSDDYDKYGYPFSKIGDKYGTYVSVKVYPKKEWESRPSLLKYNVEQEGIEIV